MSTLCGTPSSLLSNETVNGWFAGAARQSVEYAEFCAERLPGFDEVVLEYVESDDFDRLLVDTVRSTFPPQEHDHFVPLAEQPVTPEHLRDLR